MRVFSFIIIILLALPTQVVGYLSSVLHVMKYEAGHHHDHEDVDLAKDFSKHDGHMPKDFTHQHDSNDPLHSHAKDLNVNLPQLVLPIQFNLLIDLVFIKPDVRRPWTDPFVDSILYKSLLRPPIA